LNVKNNYTTFFENIYRESADPFFQFLQKEKELLEIEELFP